MIKPISLYKKGDISGILSFQVMGRGSLHAVDRLSLGPGVQVLHNNAIQPVSRGFSLDAMTAGVIRMIQHGRECREASPSGWPVRFPTVVFTTRPEPKI